MDDDVVAALRGADVELAVRPGGGGLVILEHAADTSGTDRERLAIVPRSREAAG